MKSIITILLLLIGTNLFGQSDVNTIEKFIDDAKNNAVSDLDLIEKYFVFESVKKNSDIENIVLPILIPQLDLLKQKLNGDCSELKILKHDEYSDIINTYKLKSDSFDCVYYIICDNIIVTPVLIKGNKILSLSTYSKNKEGAKNFIMF